MSDRIRIGLIGCGSLSQIGILPQLAEPDAREQIEFVAVCDTVAARAEETARAYDVPHAFTDPDDVINHNDIDLILVITPIGLHFPLAMQALRAGKHVYVQKTMTTTYEEAKQLVATARVRNLTLVSAPGQMLAPAMQAMRTLVTSGALGDVYWAWGSTGGWQHHLEANRQGDDPRSSADPSWYYSKSGGPLRDVTVYVLHSLTGILGPAKRVTAMSGIRTTQHTWRDKVIPVEIDDNTLLMLDFGDVTFAVLGGHSAKTGRLIQWGGMGIYGSHGSVEALEVEPLSGHPVRLSINGDADLPGWERTSEDTYTLLTHMPHVNDRHAAIPEPHVYADIMHCVDCIRTGEQPIASGEHAAHVIEIIEKAYLAAETGQAQDLESTFSLH
ncbi:MAG TPA: Gfo/Idh/MocA family oxidoreductase [Thermomicrobiales bacterium]|nr:Gfo/Idh/MocA family oxidoreductase [Thermomicrobiales bacterium]